MTLINIILNKKGDVILINIDKGKKILLIIFMLMILLVDNGNTFAYLFDKTSSLTSVFMPSEYLTGSFVIDNKIEHSYGDGYVIPDNIVFEYKINLGNYYANQEISTSIGDYTADENGIVSLKIKGNSKVVVNDINEDTEVIVSEIINNYGFSIKNDIDREFVVLSNDEVIIEYINVYKALSIKGEDIALKGNKVLEGRDWQEGDKFSFALEYLNDDNVWIELGTKIIEYDIENDEFNEFDFTDILQEFEFNRVGTYSFRIYEEVGGLENINYDKTINKFNIVVSDTLMDGSLEISEINGYNNINVVNQDGIYNIDVKFNNTYVFEEIEYVDDKEESMLVDDNIVVKNNEYDIDTVLSKFDGLGSNYTYTVYDKDDEVIEIDKLRTGDYIKINSNDKEYTYSIVVSGDVSGDGDISYLDYVKVYNHIQKVKNPESTKNELFDEYLLAADMSGEGKISYLDYVKIYNKIKELKGETK